MVSLVTSNEGVHGVFLRKDKAVEYCNIVKQTYPEARVRSYALQ